MVEPLHPNPPLLQLGQSRVGNYLCIESFGETGQAICNKAIN